MRVWLRLVTGGISAATLKCAAAARPNPNVESVPTFSAQRGFMFPVGLKSVTRGVLGSVVMSVCLLGSDLGHMESLDLLILIKVRPKNHNFHLF